MIIKIASCMLAGALFVSCASTQVTKTGTLEERTRQQSMAYTTAQPPPPAEGPEDVPADAPADLNIIPRWSLPRYCEHRLRPGSSGELSVSRDTTSRVLRAIR